MVLSRSLRAVAVLHDARSNSQEPLSGSTAIHPISTAGKYLLYDCKDERGRHIVCRAEIKVGQREEPKPQARAAARSSPAKELTLDLGGGLSMKLVLIPAGKFTMGSLVSERLAAARQMKAAAEATIGLDRSIEEIAKALADEGPQREVTISNPFYMGICEVSQEQYEAVMGTDPSQFKGARCPVGHVLWQDAAEFCRKLSAKTGQTVRLPTEAEWEYACRAGTKTRFSFGDRDEDLHRYGNYCDKSCTYMNPPWKDKKHSDGHDTVAPVGSYKPNAWGLYDLHGNVAEWCLDWYADSYADAKSVDPQGPDSGRVHVLRGGSWY